MTEPSRLLLIPPAYLQPHDNIPHNFLIALSLNCVSYLPFSTPHPVKHTICKARVAKRNLSSIPSRMYTVSRRIASNIQCAGSTRPNFQTTRQCLQSAETLDSPLVKWFFSLSVVESDVTVHIARGGKFTTGKGRWECGNRLTGKLHRQPNQKNFYSHPWKTDGFAYQINHMILKNNNNKNNDIIWAS